MEKHLATVLSNSLILSQKRLLMNEAFSDSSVGMFSFILFVCNDTLISKTYVHF